MRIDCFVLARLLLPVVVNACSGEETGDAAMGTALEPGASESLPTAEVPETTAGDDDASNVATAQETSETEEGEVQSDVEEPQPGDPVEPQPSDAVEPQPTYVCDAKYEGPPVETPAEPLPTVFETEICNGRDSRVVAFEVSAGSAVTVTLENPTSAELVRVSFIRADTFYELLPVSDGANQAELGASTSTQMTFTPEQGGTGALYLSGSISRGEPMRLLIEQE